MLRDLLAPSKVALDVASVAEAEALGATVVDSDSFPWTVMTDPEGGEFCLFVRDEVPTYRGEGKSFL